MLGGVKLPWLAGGRRVRVPPLDLGEYLDGLERDVQVLQRLDLRDDSPAELRRRVLALADLHYVADTLFTRLQRADPTLTRATFDAHVASEFELKRVWALVVEADGPKGRGALLGRALTGLHARLRGLLTRTKSRASAKASQPTRRPSDGN